MKVVTAEFLKSAFKEDDWPKDPKPEIAFLGRSNVGKSSLINSLLSVRGLARTSSTSSNWSISLGLGTLEYQKK
jgi:GTP-binding protein